MVRNPGFLMASRQRQGRDSRHGLHQISVMRILPTGFSGWLGQTLVPPCARCAYMLEAAATLLDEARGNRA